MAGSSLLALLDDMATIMDDIVILSKVAAKKTTGVLGDDLALNAKQVSGLAAERELPIVLAVAKGSGLNKLILVPSALAVSQVLPQAIVPFLMMGGTYLCYEGFEKIWESLFHPPVGEDDVHLKKFLSMTSEEAHAYETDRIRGAVRTDFILSAEIVVITLGTVAGEPLIKQTIVLCVISALMTVGVYGFVALIVKLDDIGLYLLRQEKASELKLKVGRFLLSFAPKLMKFLGVAGTLAMFLVGGGIVIHNLQFLHAPFSNMNGILVILCELVVGAGVGATALFSRHCFNLIRRLLSSRI